jgi:hypothetical protein
MPVEIKGDQISIHGCYYSDQNSFVFELKLVGKYEGNLQWQGTGKMGVGIGGIILPERKDAFNINWRLFPENTKLPDDPKLLIITSDTISFEPNEKNYDDELRENQERINRVNNEQVNPNLTRAMVRRALLRLEESRMEFFEKDKNAMLYLRDKILTDASWEELPFLPMFFFSIDHFVTIQDVELRKDVIEYHCGDDKSFEPTINQNIEQWTKIPLLFLFVYYNDWLTPERVEELSKLSNRLRLIIEEVKKKGKDAPNKLDEIMVTVLSKLSEQERRDYFVKSLRLRDYVRSSTNISLQKLMPNDLPPPPEPPTNMRDWKCQNGEVYHGAFLRLEDEERPFEDKRVTILDSDRFEIRFRIDSLTLPDQRYLTEMLEAMEEDAAEKNNNTTQKNNDTKK